MIITKMLIYSKGYYWDWRYIIKEVDYVAVDLETTGLRPKEDRIIEIGAVKVLNGKIIDKIDMIINPRMQLPNRIVELTHISQDMVEQGIPIETAFDKFLDFAEDYPLLGHNILFDYSFLKRFAVNQRISFERLGIDTLRLSRNLLSELEHKNLASVCNFLKISVVSFHRAIDDAIASHNIYQILKNKYLYSGSLEEKEVLEKKALFEPKPLVFKLKKESPITKAQLLYLMNLTKYHKIDIELESLTKNEASRLIDNIKSCNV